MGGLHAWAGFVNHRSLHPPPLLITPHTHFLPTLTTLPRLMAADALQCPVCLDTPDGEWHQCHNGHPLCLSCFVDIRVRLCPTCRDPLPPRNRCLEKEWIVCALPAVCAHCATASTRAEVAEHERRCPQRPTHCTATALGCVWAGSVCEQEAHEAGCPLVRLHGENEGLCERLRSSQAEIQSLQARVAELEAGEGGGGSCAAGGP